MTFAADMVAELTNHPLTAPLLGGRINPRTLPAGEQFPAATYSRISDPHDYSQDGDTGLRAPRVQWSVWAKDPDAADAAANALVEVLSGRSFGGITYALVIDDRDDYEPETGLYRRLIDSQPHMEN